MKILKFGGSSVANADRIHSVTEILRKYYLSKKEKIAVVFSAMSGVTDDLISMGYAACNNDKKYLKMFESLQKRHNETAFTLIGNGPALRDLAGALDTHFKELQDLLKGVYLIGELSPRSLDLVQSFGERLNCLIITALLQKQGIKASYLNAADVVRTDNSFGNARVDIQATYKQIKNHFAKHTNLQIITGFIGSTAKGEITTLGRGGSDYTASLFGAALKASVIEIWTDVDGVLTADPRKVKDAFSLGSISYEEAMELSHFGAKVIYPPTMVPALNAGIDLVIKNTFNPEFKGTFILNKEITEKKPIKGISSIDTITVLRIQGGGMIGISGTASRLFKALASKKVNVILITQASSEHSICIAVAPAEAERAQSAIREEFAAEIKEGRISEITAEQECSIIAVVGENMRHSPGIAGRVFHSLGKNGVNIIAIAQGSSELNISLVISKRDLTKALNVLHEALFISNTVNLNVFVAGAGLVGKELIGLLHKQKEHFNKLNVAVNLTAVCNSKKMLFVPEGMNPESAVQLLETKGEPVSTTGFIQKMQDVNLPFSIFVDCTANTTFVPHYASILGNSISVVTPNKIANTQDISKYKQLRETAAKFNAEFRYATNVGAALPIITVIKDLIENGDEIIKIEGVLSGTLSFLFNEFNKQERSFSQLVREAKELGYTEPDPRDDLSGLDVARKLLILIRETGKHLELDDIKVTDLVNPAAKKPKDIQRFFDEYAKEDDAMNTRLARAKKNGKKLVYIARYEGGKASAGPVEIAPDHPFSSLQGTDTIIAVSSQLHCNRPLIIRGQGAGAVYTAFGVLSDILRIKR